MMDIYTNIKFEISANNYLYIRHRLSGNILLLYKGIVSDLM